MKQLCLLFILLSLLLPSLYSQNTILWSDPIPVADETYGNRGPKIGLDAANNPVVMWGKPGSNSVIYVSRWDGGIFTTPVEVNGNIPPFVNSAEGPQMAVKDNRVFITYSDKNDYYNGIYVARSTDGGQTFETPVQLIQGSNHYNTLPAVAIDENDNPVIAFLGATTNYEEAKIKLSYSTDGGMTYGNPVVASEGVNGEYVCECCPPELLLDNGKTYSFFRNNDNNLRDIWMTASTDSEQFDQVLDIDPSDWQISACPASGPASIRLEDELLVAYMSAGTGTSQIHLSRVDIADNTLVQSEVVTGLDQSSVSQNFPAIAGGAEQAAVVWHQLWDGTVDIMFAFSDGGAEQIYGEARSLTANLSGHQRYPSIAFDGTDFHLIFESNGQVLYTKGSVGMVSSTVSKTERVDAAVISANPFSESLNLESEKEVQHLSICNVNGQVFFEKTAFVGSTQLNTTQWAKGIYFLNYWFKGQYQSYRLLRR
ncbi:MAG: T9SS type A sorting domain-containing protein [Chitinophagales bacterium]|nr:T9SS type A sorting domain-containing protein [Chitinophagales bacterium]